jgi:hypothetical protein
MIKRRRRFTQTVSLKDRLSTFAKDLRDEASQLSAGPERDDILKRARRADTAAHLDEWAHSAGLKSPS